jgi:uncharacterized protein (TIGR03437 family)
MKRILLPAISALVMLTPAADAYIRSSFSYTDGSFAFIKRSDASGAGVQFYVNSLIAAGLQSSATGKSVTVVTTGSNPVAAIRTSAITWNGINGSALHFLAIQSTTKGIDSTDGQNTIAFGSTAADLSLLGGALAFTVNSGASFTVGTGPTGDVADSDIMLNPAYSFSTDGTTNYDLQAVMTHEFGHVLGLNHTGLVGATMFQFPYLAARFLSSDELAFAAAIYPRATPSLGTLAGKVVAADGSPVQTGLMTIIDTSGGTALSALTAADGTWSVQAPPGSYVVYADALTSTSLVEAGNLYLTTATTVTSNFQATMLGGFSSPMALAVTSGNTTTAPNLTVTAGSTPLVYNSGGVSQLNNTGIVVQSGQSVLLTVRGTGLDPTATVQAFGAGVVVHPGSVVADPNSSAGFKVTLDIAARTTPALASLIITKGSNVLALSGILSVVPPAPKFTAAGVVNAASYKGPTAAGGVSPGGIYSIYDSTGNSLGPNPFVQPSGYDPYGNLGTSLGGVSVTFDGVPAPLYLSYAGQLNLQAPFELAGKSSTQVVVSFYGSASAPVTVPVVATQPSFFTATPLGADSIIQNFPDYSLNGNGNAVARGGTVLIYGTGIGKLNYALATGQPGVVPPSTANNASCSFGGQSTPAFTYWNYGFVGEAIWVATVPAASPTGSVTITCTDPTGAATQAGTIYVK